MDKEKQIANQILDGIELNIEEINILKGSITDLLVSFMLKSQNIMNEIPDEKTFKKIIAEIINKKIVKKFPFMIRRVILTINLTLIIINALDKYGLDRFCGENWYSKIRTKVIQLLGKYGK